MDRVTHFSQVAWGKKQVTNEEAEWRVEVRMQMEKTVSPFPS